MVDSCYRDCHKNSYFHTFNYSSVNFIKFTNIGNNEVINLKISGKNMGLCELKKI